MSVTITYGTYNFSPVPLINLTKEFKKTEDGRLLNSVNKISMEGFLIANNQGIINTTTLKTALENAMSQNGCQFLWKCDDTTIYTGYARTISLNFKSTNNNWVSSIGYNIEIECDDNIASEITSAGPGLDSASEDWNIEPMDEKGYWTWNIGTTDSSAQMYKLSHTLTAKGRSIYSACGSLSGNIEGWQWARSFCSGRAGYVNNPVIHGLPNVSYTPFNHTRSQQANRLGGTYTLNESWLLMKSGNGVPYNAMEDFNVDIKQSDENDIITVGINGTIYGVETRTYSTSDTISNSTTTTKYDNALAYWNIAKGRLANRAQKALTNSALSYTRAINPLKVNRSLGQNPAAGTITYGYEYSNKVPSCIPGALSENIQISVENPNDVFASLTVLGRTSGPIIQLMGTRTAYVYNITIDAVVPAVTGCSFSDYTHTNAASPRTAVKAMLSGVEDTFESSFGQLVKTGDTENWSPREGKYNRRIQWTLVECNGAGTTIASL